MGVVEGASLVYDDNIGKLVYYLSSDDEYVDDI